VSGAYSFDSNSFQYIVDGTNNLPTSDSPRTVAAWIKTSTSDTDRYFYHYGDEYYTGFYFGVYQSRLIFTSGGWGQTYGTTVVNDDAWHYVSLTIDGSHILRMYVDGVDEGMSEDVTNAGTTNSKAETGTCSTQSSGCAFNGQIDELAVWNRALSSDEISQLYNFGSGRSLINQ
jgi:hypothetical protein